MLVCAVVIGVRAPELITSPRLWSEEGAVYFAAALADGASALWAPHMGYVSIVPNVATTFASFGPLESVPTITTWTALLVQLLPVSVVIFGKAPIWADHRARCVGVLVILVAQNGSATWLSMILSQFHLCLLAFTILLEPTDELSPRRRWCYRVGLALAALGGPPAAFLVPAALLRAWLRRDRESRVQAGILAAGACVQAIAFASAAATSSGPSRFTTPSLLGMGPIAWVKTVVLPAFGSRYSDPLGLRLSADAVEGAGYFVPVSILSLLVLLAALAALARGDRSRIVTVVAYLGVLVPSIWFSAGSYHLPHRAEMLRPYMGQRYLYVPSVLLLLLLLQRAFTAHQGRWQLAGRAVSAAVLVSALLIGSLEYRFEMRVFRNRGPAWPDEIARWRADPNYRVRIWPHTVTMSIPAELR